MRGAYLVDQLLALPARLLQFRGRGLQCFLRRIALGELAHLGERAVVGGIRFVAPPLEIRGQAVTQSIAARCDLRQECPRTVALGYVEGRGRLLRGDEQVEVVPVERRVSVTESGLHFVRAAERR